MTPLISTPARERRRLEGLDRGSLREYQLGRLNSLLDQVLPKNSFYAEKFSGGRFPLSDLDELAALPMTTKAELIGGGEPGALAANLTYSPENYLRYHQTSGTRGRPLAVLDTADDWRWWMDVWQYVFDAAEITPNDRAFLAFSFGPFIGFWSAHDAVAARGTMVIPGGGMGTAARLALMESTQATAVFCTPTYALRMAEVAAEEGVDLRALSVRRLVVAGEPGGSVPSVRRAIEAAWGATVIDHSGASEVGPWGYGDAEGRGLWINEAEFIPEFISLETGTPAGEGELAELVLTNLGRAGFPVVRYRTGDLVRPTWTSTGPRRFVFLEGGVLSRADDMMIIRGVNIFPSSIEEILRAFPEIAEYRITASRHREMDRLAVEVEDRANDPQRIARELELRLGLKVDVQCVTQGTLPRFELKGKRFIDQRVPGANAG